VIDLCAALFDWAQFRRTKGGVKLHCLLDHDGYVPSVVVITEGKQHDVRVARTLRFDPGTIVVMDRGYTDYAWFGHLTAQRVWFVTRLKDPAVYAAVEERRIPAQSRVERDQIIRLTGVGAADKCPHALRRIEVYDPEKDETLVFLPRAAIQRQRPWTREGPCRSHRRLLWGGRRDARPGHRAARRSCRQAVCRGAS
jgi:hypothetical protein